MSLQSTKYSRYLGLMERHLINTDGQDPVGGGPAGVAHAGGKDELTSCRATV